MSTERGVRADEPVERIKRTLDLELEPLDRPRPPLHPARFDKPAVGLVVNDGEADAVAGAILRVNQAGHHVLVTGGRSPDHEGLAFARELGATVVDADVTGDGDPIQRLFNAARHYGFPGLVYTESVSERIDIERSVEALQTDDRYAMEAYPDAGETAGVVVGLPAYNEEVSIGSVVLGASEHAEEVIVVDDGSTDDTVSVAEAAGATVIVHGDNRGKGAALRTLLNYANEIDLEALVLIDGDGQHSTDEIPTLVELVREGGADVALGSRYLDGRDHDTPAYRRVGQRVLDVLTAGASGTTITDSQSGFRALSPSAIASLEPSTNGFAVDSEMIDEAARRGLEIAEAPVEVRYDGVDGSTRNPLHHGFSVVLFLVQLVRDRHPLLFFSLPGMLLVAFGIVYGVDGILVYHATGAFYPAKAMASGFATVVGVVGVFAGFVLNSFANRIEELKGVG